MRRGDSFFLLEGSQASPARPSDISRKKREGEREREKKRNWGNSERQCILRGRVAKHFPGIVRSSFW
jgi:hypothetical protein